MSTVVDARWLVRIGVAMTLVGISTGRAADEPKEAPKSREQRLVEERGELMRQLIVAGEVTSATKGFPAQFESKPLFRYSDPARGAIAGSVWKLGDTGRPRALLAMEIHIAKYRKPVVMYEYMSLTTTPFHFKARGIDWQPSRTLFEFKPIRNTSPPEKTPARRLIQMREIAKRFSASEVDNKERCELRLLPQPIDRYKPSSAELSEGAIFLFSFGTNPEVVLFIESDGTDWSYAAGRMTGAEVVEVQLDGKTAWIGAPLESGPKSPYTGSVLAIEIPGYDKNGNEVTE